jgi:radical SAM protein with 4Fe4S-binding SPASM domain
MANEELIFILKDCGCRCIHFGLQSGSEKVRFQVLDRTERNSTVIKAAQLCHKYGIKFSAHCILNLPGETQNDIRESLKTYNAMRPHDVSVYSLLYLPRSPIIKKAIEEKILTEEDEAKINSGLHNMNPRILLKANKVEGRTDTYRKYAALFTLIPLLPKRWIDNLSNNQNRFNRFHLPLLIIPFVKIFTLAKGGWGMLLPCLFITEFLNAVYHIKESIRLRLRKRAEKISPGIRRFKYFYLNLLFVFTLVKKRKLTPKKIFNLFSNIIRYRFKNKKASAYPSVIIFEITNRCNLYCTACRYTPTHILDQSGEDAKIPLGEMDLKIFYRAVDEASDYLLLALMYLAGEPLLNPDIFKMLKKADERKVPVILSTNGMLLNRANCIKLIESGIDLVKIALSGYRQESYEKEHRGGNIKVVLDNISTLVEIKKMYKSDAIIMVDYILFEHNEQDFPLMQRFCDNLGIMINRRAARTNKQESIKTSSLESITANTSLCDWLWKTMSVNWDGRIFPCCEYSFWGKPEVLGQYNNNGASIREIWNNQEYQKYRLAHIRYGRAGIDRCKGCHYNGLRFQG